MSDPTDQLSSACTRWKLAELPGGKLRATFDGQDGTNVDDIQEVQPLDGAAEYAGQ